MQDVVGGRRDGQRSEIERLALVEVAGPFGRTVVTRPLIRQCTGQRQQQDRREWQAGAQGLRQGEDVRGYIRVLEGEIVAGTVIQIDRDFIVLSADLAGSVSTEVVYHELTHYLASRAMLRPPTWLNEGLGEYFGSASISGNRSSTLVSSAVCPMNSR